MDSAGCIYICMYVYMCVHLYVTLIQEESTKFRRIERDMGEVGRSGNIVFVYEILQKIELIECSQKRKKGRKEENKEKKRKTRSWGVYPTSYCLRATSKTWLPDNWGQLPRCQRSLPRQTGHRSMLSVHRPLFKPRDPRASCHGHLAPASTRSFSDLLYPSVKPLRWGGV